MKQDKKYEKNDSDRVGCDELRYELESLDREYVEVRGIKLRPSQCFRITNKNFQVIFNSNCPGSLKEKVRSILAKYSGKGENYPLEQEFFFP